MTTGAEPLNIRAAVARIDRELAEGSTRAEDRWLVPFIAVWLTLMAVVGFLAGLVTGFHIGH
jgi:hypothetical protein